MNSSRNILKNSSNENSTISSAISSSDITTKGLKGIKKLDFIAIEKAIVENNGRGYLSRRGYDALCLASELGQGEGEYKCSHPVHDYDFKTDIDIPSDYKDVDIEEIVILIIEARLGFEKSYETLTRIFEKPLSKEKKRYRRVSKNDDAESIINEIFLQVVCRHIIVVDGKILSPLTYFYVIKSGMYRYVTECEGLLKYSHEALEEAISDAKDEDISPHALMIRLSLKCRWESLFFEKKAEGGDVIVEDRFSDPRDVISERESELDVERAFEKSIPQEAMRICTMLSLMCDWTARDIADNYGLKYHTVRRTIKKGTALIMQYLLQNGDVPREYLDK